MLKVFAVQVRKRTARDQRRRNATLRWRVRLHFSRQVIVVLIGAVFFVDFYTRDGSESWARVLKNALGDIGLSLTAPSLRGFLAPPRLQRHLVAVVAVVGARS